MIVLCSPTMRVAARKWVVTTNNKNRTLSTTKMALLLLPTWVTVVVAKVATCTNTGTTNVALFSTATTSAMTVPTWIVHHRHTLLRTVRSSQRRRGSSSSSSSRRSHSLSFHHSHVRTNKVIHRVPFFNEPRLYVSNDRRFGDITERPLSSSSPSSVIQQQPLPPPSSELTSEMLSLRFRDVFVHFQSVQLQQQSTSTSNTITTLPDQSTIRMNLLRTRHPHLELKKCRMDHSSIPNAGNGVYTTQDIRTNELITLYPGDAILQWKHKDHLDPNTNGGIQIYFGTHIPESERIVAALDNNNNNHHPNTNSNDPNDTNATTIFMNHIPTARSYEIRVNDTLSVIGDPNRHADPAYLGHMINDYCTIDDDDTHDGTDVSLNDDEVIRQYNIQSIQRSNCKIQIGVEHQCHVEIIATKHIAVGEELFLSYGSNYWLSRRRTYGETRTATSVVDHATVGVTATTTSRQTVDALTKTRGFATSTTLDKKESQKKKR